MANPFFPSDDDDGSGSTALNLFDGIERFWKRLTGQQSQEDINNAQLAFSQQQLDYQKSIDAFNKDYTLNQNYYMVKDMQKAGLNPIAISGSSGSHVSSSGASAPNLQAGPSTLSALIPLLSLGADMMNSSRDLNLKKDSLDSQNNNFSKNLEHQQNVLALDKIKEQNNKTLIDAQAGLMNAQARIQNATANHLEDYGTLPGTDTNIFRGAQNLFGVGKDVKDKVDSYSRASVEKMANDLTRPSFMSILNGDSTFGAFVNKRLSGRPLQSLTLNDMRSLYLEFYGGKK